MATKYEISKEAVETLVQHLRTLRGPTWAETNTILAFLDKHLTPVDDAPAEQKGN